MRRVNFILVSFLMLAVLLVIEILIVRKASDCEPEVRVVFAAERIPQGAVIQPEMLELKEISVSMAHRQSLRDISQAAGKRTEADIEEGEMLLVSRLDGETGGEPILEDPGSRLFSVEFKGDQANGWWLEPGQRVDIIFVPDRKSATGAGVNTRESAGGSSGMSSGDYAGTRLENAREIQRLNNIRIAAIMDERGKQLKGLERNVIPRYISFEVTEKESEFLALAKGGGRLEICLIPGNTGR